MTAVLASARADAGKWFYFWMALTCLAVAVLGFMPTFFVPLVQGTFVRAPIFHVHGMLFFGWTIFFCTQAWLVANGRIIAHREWGVAGAAIATGMVFSTLSVVIVRLKEGLPAELAWGVLSALAYFVVCIAAALANTRRPETHKRFILLGTISLLGAPVGRWVLILFPLPPTFDPAHAPFSVFLPPLGPALLMLVAMTIDWRMRGRVSPIYAIGLAIFLLLDFAALPVVGSTGAPQAIATRLKGAGG